MAEASEWAYVYVILVGIGLAITLFVIRWYSSKDTKHENKKPILNKCEQSGNTMTFSKSNLLQMNATIIAGLFILMTIQGPESAGIPSLIDADLIDKKIDTYKVMINDTRLDQSVRDEAKKRLAESTIDLNEYYLSLHNAQKFQLARFFFTSTSFFWISLAFFVLSSLVALVNNNENNRSFNTSIGLAMTGFIWIVVGLYIYLAIPRLP